MPRDAQTLHQRKLHDKRGALTDLMRHLGLFNDNLNLGGTLGLRWEDVLTRISQMNP